MNRGEEYNPVIKNIYQAFIKKTKEEFIEEYRLKLGNKISELEGSYIDIFKKL